MDKHWITQARSWLIASREPIPHEINELDWKCGLSENKERLAEHLIAFANHPGGGYLVYGVTNPNGELAGVTKNETVDIISKLAHLGRDAVEPAYKPRWYRCCS